MPNECYLVTYIVTFKKMRVNMGIMTNLNTKMYHIDIKFEEN